MAEEIISIQQIKSYNRLEDPLIPVDKDLFKELDGDSSKESLKIKKKSNSGMRKLKSETQNQNNIKVLLKSDINSKISNEAIDAFINAARIGNIDEVKRFLENGIDVNVKNIYKQTALHSAARSGHEKIVDYLLSYENIEIDATDIRGQTPFLFAVKNNKINIVKKFIDSKKVNLNITTTAWKLTALHLAIEEYASIEIIQILLDAGVNPFAKDFFGKTPLDRAVEYNNKEAIELLNEAMKK